MSRSIYQTNGKPLSPEAIYQQKLKQGIYTSPNIGNVGVNSSASDTAALLAASSDLTVKPSYERTIAQEAQDAALSAKLEKIYQWSRTVDANAENAAISLLYGNKDKDNNGFGNEKDSKSSNGTMTSSSLGIPSMKGSIIYKAANEKSTLTMTSRINPEKNSSHGLKPQSSKISLNIGKISTLANSNSSKTMDSRINPEYNSGRSGLTTKNGRSKSFQAGDISGSYLLNAANEKANNRLNSLKNYGKPEDFKAQAQLYANALAIAQKRSDERIKNHKTGVIDLGGGLTVTQSELDKLASIYVTPVLNDINLKAKQQRDADKLKEQQKQDLVKQHNEFKLNELKEKQQEKEDLEKAKQERIVKNDEEKNLKDEEYLTYQGEENDKVTAKQGELTEQEGIHSTKKEELLLQKQENQDKIDNEEQELISSRAKELEEMQNERDVEIEPILNELKIENEKLQDVTNAKNELSEEVDGLDKLNKELEEKLKELEEKIKSTDDDIELNTKELEIHENKLNESNTNVENLKNLSNKEIDELNQESENLDKEIDDLTKTKDNHINEKASKKDEIKKGLDERLKEEHEINNELPVHLRKDIDEKKLLDTSSIFSNEPKVVAAPVGTPTPAAAATSATPVAKTSKPSTKEKASTLRRLSNIFKRKSVSGAAATSATAGATAAAVAKSTAKNLKADGEGILESAKKGGEEGVKAGKKVIEKDNESEFVDDLSIQNNKGGLFKEEI